MREGKAGLGESAYGVILSEAWKNTFFFRMNAWIHMLAYTCVTESHVHSSRTSGEKLSKG